MASMNIELHMWINNVTFDNGESEVSWAIFRGSSRTRKCREREREKAHDKKKVDSKIQVWAVADCRRRWIMPTKQA
ncbi:hypothetical protein TIFTF001_011753 [Ficus carica]|uniref:Uncharacterized protein n=1 Tax=Ficus carica TaxID=3494 RepID=A0AA88D5N0_FICCA|nr:hypothetical protein TIFTF001_011753 [Ficus carica]